MIEPEKGDHAMNRSRYSEEQISFVLKHAEQGAPVPEVCRLKKVDGSKFTGGSQRL